MFNENEREITVYPYLEEISDIDEIHHTITYFMILILIWTDSRIILRDDVTSHHFLPTSLELG